MPGVQRALTPGSSWEQEDPSLIDGRRDHGKRVLKGWRGLVAGDGEADGGARSAHWPARAGSPRSLALRWLCLQPPEFCPQLPGSLPFPAALISSHFQYRGQISRFLQWLLPLCPRI